MNLLPVLVSKSSVRVSVGAKASLLAVAVISACWTSQIDAFASTNSSWSSQPNWADF